MADQKGPREVVGLSFWGFSEFCCPGGRSCDGSPAGGLGIWDMGVEDEASAPTTAAADASSCFLLKFMLYETRSKYYVVGRNKDRTIWRVLKVDRLESTELNVREDSATYSQIECFDLLKRIHEGNRSTGGLKLVTKCYGIVGFIKFLGPYYMLLVTKRRQIGSICGHTIYAINKTEMIPIPNSSVQSSKSYSKNENRYKKLLCTVDLTKDFFFSYSYHVMHSVQKNLCNDETGHVLYETMFVWNEFLTRGIRNHLKSSIWTVALVYGFFKQAKLSIGGKDFKLTLIARRSRHYAGTRYLKRGVNEKGRVANDVETEQIVFEDVLEGQPWYISSVVQNRGSIPLFWSQETSRLNIKPDIILQKKDINYEATRLHFENLVKRYGNPIIILNLIKTREKRPRESILRIEFANAIDFINKDLEEENRLKFLHWDLHKHSRSKATNVLSLLGQVAEYALNKTGIFYCELSSSSKIDSLKSSHEREQSPRCSAEENKINGMDSPSITTLVTQPENKDFFGNNVVRLPKYQKGVLRTNCIDCLDRTNVAQFTYGLAALGSQLHALGLIGNPKVDLDSPLADDLMSLYEAMGDTLALQYGGSAAHNKIFSQRRGQCKAATQSQEFFRTLQRYYSNAYMDAEKQDAINIFLGYFQPQQGKPALWELDSDQHYSIRRRGNIDEDENTRTTPIKRSLSDGNIFCESKTPLSGRNGEEKKLVNSTLPEIGECASKCPESTVGISTSDLDASYSRYLSSIVHRRLFPDRSLENNHIYFNKFGAGDELNCTNFLDLDWLSSSGNSIEEEISDRSALLNSPLACMSSENVVNEVNSETTQPTSECESSIKEREQSETELSYTGVQTAEVLSEFSDSFVHWVNYGQTLCH